MLFLNRNNKHCFSKKSLIGCGLLCFLAFTYTTPWDSYLIEQNIWNYSPGHVLGTLFLIPFEEYFFFFIQSIIGCFFTSFILSKRKQKKQYNLSVSSNNLIFIGALFTFCSLGFYFLIPQGSIRYLLLILFWGVPIVGLQWILGFSILKSERITLITSLFFLTIYFWIADSIAIYKSIWVLPPETITNIKIMNILPIEEALFFLITNIMVVQGYILFTKVNKISFLRKMEWRL